MIKWNCAFQIPDSTVQLAEAFVSIVEVKQINANTLVLIKIADESGNTVVKEYEKIFNKTFNNTEEIYLELINDFENAEIV